MHESTMGTVVAVARFQTEPLACYRSMAITRTGPPQAGDDEL